MIQQLRERDEAVTIQEAVIFLEKKDNKRHFRAPNPPWHNFKLRPDSLDILLRRKQPSLIKTARLYHRKCRWKASNQLYFSCQHFRKVFTDSVDVTYRCRSKVIFSESFISHTAEIIGLRSILSLTTVGGYSPFLAKIPKFCIWQMKALLIFDINI